MREDARLLQNVRARRTFSNTMQELPSPSAHATRARTLSDLAGWLQKVLLAGAGHLPVLSALGARVYAQTSWRVDKLEKALIDLHDSVTVVAPTPAEVAQQYGELQDHARQIGRGMDQLVDDAHSFAARCKAADAELRPALSEFLLETRALQEVVERCGPWLEELRAGLDAGAVQGAALADLLEQADNFGRRLAVLQAAQRSAHNFHVLAGKVAATRPELAAAARGEVQRALSVLQGRLEQAALSGRGMAATLLAVVHARSDAQIWVAQSLALVLRLQAAQHKLAREAAALRHRCGLLLPQTGELEPAPQHDDVATLH